MNLSSEYLTFLMTKSKDTILPQTENVKLQPIQIGELDKPIELKPKIDVPSGEFSNFWCAILLVSGIGWERHQAESILKTF